MFRVLTPGFAVAGQLQPEDMATAATQGYTLVINNRPDGEEPGQPASETIAAAARAAGLAYHHIPLSGGGLTLDHITRTEEALAQAEGPVLAFCRSGMRSTTLWALARAKAGQEPQELVSTAGQAGYDLSPMVGLMTRLKQGNM
ncbi:TIGR01244 family sulfur transferase [Pedomonas sp. V897]|uniref:TIGR01244 family sulfur transferase n=1 Tax=Pedomonas sp. V897 TaxID=3446482 RepID=UPI003EE30461